MPADYNFSYIKLTINRMNFTILSFILIILVILMSIGFLWQLGINKHNSSKNLEFQKKHQRLEHLENLLKYTNDIICLFDEDFNVIAFNDQALNSYGYTTDEFKQLNIFKLRTAEAANDIYEQINQITEEKSSTYETIHQRKDGSTFPIEVTALLLIIDKKKFYHIISHDISHSKKTMEEMKKLSRAIEQSPTTIVITNYLGEIEYVNPKFSELTGYRLDETIGENPRMLNDGSTPKHESKILWDTILAGKEWKGEFHNKKKNGELYIESAVISPIFNDYGQISHFVAVKEDITEKKEAIQQLIKAKEKAEESDKLKSAFLSNMSHEIRTPMNAIIGFTEILLRPDLPDHKKERFTALIKQRSFDLLRIIEDILDISQIEIGQMKIIETYINISHILNEIYEYYNLKSYNNDPAKNITLKLSIDPELKNKIIKTDGQRLKQILNNLMDNAFKFTKTGTIEFGCNVKSATEIIFFVKDTGIGISAENQDKIFDRFRQVEETLISRQFGGTGLGLSIAKGIVMLLKGTLWVDSQLDRGTTFHFTLPYSVAENQYNINSDYDYTNTKPPNNRSILIIEDDPGSMEFICEVLNYRGLQVFKADNAENALQMFKKYNNIKIVLSDIQLPDINGLNLAVLLLGIRPQTVIIMQSAYSSPDIYKKCLDAGCKEYITKPMTKEKILSTINKYLVTSTNPV